MGRYRKPQPWGSPYITPQGKEALEEELNHLWKVERPQVTQAVHEAAKNGDRSENGDYIYGKKRLREIDRRVRYLGKRLQQLKVVDRTPDNPGKIYFGAWVSLEDDEGNTRDYRIVGPDEFDLKKNMISMDAPLAKLLLGKQVDDEVTLEAGGKRQTWYINAIRYE